MVVMSDQIGSRIKIYPEKELPCAVAHYIAADLGVTPLEVGRTADEIGIRASMCQLGLFGYAAKGRPSARIRRAMADIPPELAEAIRKAVANGCVPCAELWEIAKEFDLSRLEIGNAVEGLGVKVRPCQLGFF
jgi:hypothetical protein